MQHQRVWTPTAGEHDYTRERNLNVAPRQWIQTSCTLVPCSSVPGIQDNSSAVERQELLWRQRFSDQTLWKNDFRHKESKEPLWLNNVYKPGWVGGQLTVLDEGIGGPAQPTSKPLVHHNAEAAQAVIELCKNGKLSRAVDVLTVLAETQSRVPTSLLYRVIQRCGAEKNLVMGRRLDDLTVRLGLESNAFLGNHILRMYACQGRLQEAMQVFTRVAAPDAFMWSSVISAYARHGEPKRAIQLYQQMRSSTTVKGDGYVFVAALQACASATDLESGKQVHTDVLESGIQPDSFVCNCLVDMYAKCGDLEDARKVFDSLATKDAVIWTTMINGYAEDGLGAQALTLYARMQEEGLILADSVTYVCLLKACASVGALQDGRQLHSQILERGLLGDAVVGNCLVNMYAKCGKLEDARMVFDSLATKDAVTWTAMINAYAEHGLGPQALTLYSRMEQEGLVLANTVTFACLLKACAGAGALQQGRQLHSQILERGLLEGGTVLGNCLINMYAKCGELEDARMVFDSMATRDAVTWNAMINGYADHGLGLQALTMYAKMEQEGLILANSVTFSCLLTACARAGALHQGRQLHSQILDRGLLEGDTVLGNCLVDMYAKCGQMQDARMVFDSLATRDAVTWNVLINGYAEHGLGSEALTLYSRMEHEGLILADSATYVCLLKASASAGALQQGRQLHSQILERGLLGDTVLGNCLVNMYVKCGQLEDARMVFDGLATRDAVTWNALINGYGINNAGYKAIACFEEMMLAGIQPNDTTFTCLLVACSHEGLVRKGRQYFDAMLKHHGLNPTIEHYVCMVDLLGRAGQIDEAEKMLLSAGCETHAVGLMSLLSACKSHGDIDRGTRCFERLLELDPLDASAYVLMANMYADAGRWADVDRVERLRKLAGASKKPAMAGIEVNKEVHTFVVGEERDGDISSKVRSTNVRLKEEGNHVPHTKLVLNPLSETEKEDQLCGHAEKLALAYGLLNTPDGTPLLVTKNLRMCGDCHSSTEIMSRVEKRDIVVRDAHRVHRFEGGSCSCKGRH